MSDAMVEISAAELQTLRNATKLLDTLWNDPKKGLEFKQRVREVMPDIKVPELDIVAAATAPLTASMDEIRAENKRLSDEIAADKLARQTEADTAKLNLTLKQVQDKFHLTDEGMAKVKERMIANNNPDAEAAAYAVLGSQPKPEPTAGSGIMPERLNLFGAGEVSDDESLKRLNEDPRKWADREIATMLNEFANGEAA